MDYRISPEDRARFKRCRRQWDFASPHRRDLEPAESNETSTLSTALKDALAVYYYPGTWDWQHQLKQSLVHKAMRRSLEEAGAVDGLATATALLDCYDAWAATVDDFAPVKIQHDVTALVRDPVDPELGLLTPDGSGVVYACRVDLLAVDAADEYWVVRHQIVDGWRTAEELVFDEEAIAACWAWEQDYIGMEVAGTIHNEIRIDGPPINRRRPGRWHNTNPAVAAAPSRSTCGLRPATPDPPTAAAPSSAPQGSCGAPGSGAAATRSPPLEVSSRQKPSRWPVHRPPIPVPDRTASRVSSWRPVGPCSKAPTPNRCWRSTFIHARVTPSRSRDWVRRRGASAEERHHRLGERNLRAQA